MKQPHRHPTCLGQTPCLLSTSGLGGSCCAALIPFNSSLARVTPFGPETSSNYLPRYLVGSTMDREMPQRECSHPLPPLSTDRPPVFRPGPFPSYQSQWRAECQQEKRSDSFVQIAPQENTRRDHPRWRRQSSTNYNSSDTPPPPGARRLRSPQYKPYALRWPFLTALLLSVFTLAGLLGVALHLLPIEHTDSLGQMAKRGVPNESRGRSPKHHHVLATGDGISDRGLNMSLSQSLHSASEMTATKTSISPVEIASIPSGIGSGGLVRWEGFLRPGKETITIHWKLMHRTDSPATATMLSESITPKIETSAAVVGVLVDMEQWSEADERVITPSDEPVPMAKPSSTTSAASLPSLILPVTLGGRDPRSARSHGLNPSNEADIGKVLGNLAFINPGQHTVTIQKRIEQTTHALNIDSSGISSAQAAGAAHSASRTGIEQITPILGGTGSNIGKGAFMKPGKHTVTFLDIFRRSNGIASTATSPSTTSGAAPPTFPTLSRLTTIDEPDSGTEGGLPPDAFIPHGIVLVTFDDKLPRRTEAAVSTSTTMAVSPLSPTNSLYESMTTMAATSSGAAPSDGVMGVPAAGFLGCGKKTRTCDDVLQQRTQIPIPIIPITPAATATDAITASGKNLVSIYTEIFSKGQNLPKSRYPFRNHSTTTRMGRDGSPVSSYHSSHHPVSTARLPLNTSQPRPGATTLQVTTVVYDLQMGSYFVCFFLPTLLCTLLQIPVRMVDQSVRLLQPFHEMADPDGACGRDSLWRETAGWRCRVASLRHLFRKKQSLVFLTGVLQAITWLVVSFSATAVGLQLVGSGCEADDPYSVQNNCAMTPAVFWRPTIIILSLLGLMAAILVFIMVKLARWDIGVDEDPWSIAGIARLSRNKDLRPLLHQKALGTAEYHRLWATKFTLGYFSNESRYNKKVYGVVALGTNLSSGSTRSLPATVSTFLGTSSTWITEKLRPTTRVNDNTRPSEKLELPFILGYTGRILFLLFLCGLMIVILYYRNVSTSSGFESFMDDESY